MTRQKIKISFLFVVHYFSFLSSMNEFLLDCFLLAIFVLGVVIFFSSFYVPLCIGVRLLCRRVQVHMTRRRIF